MRFTHRFGQRERKVCGNSEWRSASRLVGSGGITRLGGGGQNAGRSADAVRLDQPPGSPKRLMCAGTRFAVGQGANLRIGRSRIGLRLLTILGISPKETTVDVPGDITFGNRAKARREG
jgi:hypothetical protein